MGKILPVNFKVTLPELHEAQLRVHDNPTRFRVLAAGRRFGKSTLAKNEILDAAINKSHKVWFVTLTYNNAMTHWRDVKRLVGDLPTLKSEQQKYLEFERADGKVGSISFKSGDSPDNLLGEGLDFVVVDEAAYQSPLLWQRVLRPMLSDRQGKALLISTPNGTVNWFHSVFLRGMDVAEADWQSFRFRTVDSPYITPKEVEDAKSDLPELIYRQEFLAEFVSDAGGVFHGVEAVSVLEPTAGPDPDRIYYCGIDWGRKNDFTVINIFDDLGNQCDIVRFTEIGWEQQYTRIEALYKKWGFVKMYVEANAAGGPNCEALKSMGMPVIDVYMTNVLKVSLVNQLVLNIEKGHIKLLSTRTPEGMLQQGELLSFSLYRTNGGMNITYKAPDDGHDDIAISLMLVNQTFYKTRGAAITVSPNIFYSSKPTQPDLPKEWLLNGAK